MRKIFPGLLSLLFLFISLTSFAQKALPQTTLTTKDFDEKIEKLNDFFEDWNVGNLHVYTKQNDQEKADGEFYFAGKEIPRGYFDLIDPEWRTNFDDKLKAFALGITKGTAAQNPLYLIRSELPNGISTIDLFAIEGKVLRHRQQLSTHWCTNEYCFQQDSWIQDFDGDTRLDVLKKIKVSQKHSAGKETIDQYHAVYQQQLDGQFTPEDEIKVAIRDYIME